MYFDEKDENGDLIPAGYVDVTLNIYKEYCSGEHAGAFEKSTTSNKYGLVNFNYTYQYKFANTQDIVYYSLIITRGDNRTEKNGNITYWDKELFINTNVDGNKHLDLNDKFSYPGGIILYWD